VSRTSQLTISEQPNILLIMSDQHDPAVSGCYGDPVVETPNMNRLAAEGVRFDACYTNSPLCVPARLSFTAGKYVSRVGAWSNRCWLPSADYPYIATALQAGGYETFLCGKMHYDASRRYGFTDILPEAPSNYAWKHGQTPRRSAADETPDTENWARRAAHIHTGNESKTLNHDRLVTSRACQFLQHWPADRQDRAPFFLLVGHVAPHLPLVAPESIYRKYRDRVPMPDVPEGVIERLPRNYKHLRYGFGLTDLDPETVKYARELYWALTDWYDQQLGQVLDALDNSAVADNTVVIYTSDHGENKGDHGLWWKNNMYEHAARVPLIVRWPQRWAPGQSRTQACSLVDVIQTLVDIGGGVCPENWDGDSMLPWLDDPDYDWKDYAVSEYYGHSITSGFAMLRSGPWKYVYHTAADSTHPAECELYNLETDPREFRNRAEDPDQTERARAMHRMLVEEIGEDPEQTEKRCRQDFVRGYERDAAAP